VYVPTETTNLDIYGSAPLSWSRAEEALAQAPSGPEITFFLGTVGRDGRPHVAGVGAMYHRGELYFVSGPTTSKTRNLAANPVCTMGVHLPGIDLCLEGDAQRVRDPAVVDRLAGVYRDVGWPAQAAGDTLTAPYSAPSAGPPPWYLYRMQIHTVIAVASAEPHGATRWRFR
jgi:hypothetical protein